MKIWDFICYLNLNFDNKTSNSSLSKSILMCPPQLDPKPLQCPQTLLDRYEDIIRVFAFANVFCPNISSVAIRGLSERHTPLVSLRVQTHSIHPPNHKCGTMWNMYTHGFGFEKQTQNATYIIQNQERSVSVNLPAQIKMSYLLRSQQPRYISGQIVGGGQVRWVYFLSTCAAHCYGLEYIFWYVVDKLYTKKWCHNLIKVVVIFPAISEIERSRVVRKCI